MTSAAARSQPRPLSLHRRSNAEQQNTKARPPRLRGDRLSALACRGPIDGLCAQLRQPLPYVLSEEFALAVEQS